MSRFEISRNHSLGADTLHEIVQKVGDELVQKHGGSTRWEGDELHYKQPMGIHGILTWDERSLHIDVKLGVMAGMFRSVIEDEVNHRLDKLLATYRKP